MGHPVLILYNLCIHPSIHVGVPNRAKNHEAVAFLPISFPLSGAAHAHLMIKAKGGCAAAPTLSSSNSIVRFFRLVTRPSGSVRVRSLLFQMHRRRESGEDKAERRAASVQKKFSNRLG